MLTLELKINGIIVSVVKILNSGETIGKTTLYYVEAYVPSEEYDFGKMINVEVEHDRRDGLMILSQKVINKVVEKL